MYTSQSIGVTLTVLFCWLVCEVSVSVFGNKANIIGKKPSVKNHSLEEFRGEECVCGWMQLPIMNIIFLRFSKIKVVIL